MIISNIRIMNREFVETTIFIKDWERLGFNDDDLCRLQETITANPSVGVIVKGTGGLRKMRFAFSNKGKSGSVRVCYADFESSKKVILVAAYSKNEKDNFSEYERNVLYKIMEDLKKYYGGSIDAKE